MNIADCHYPYSFQDEVKLLMDDKQQLPLVKMHVQKLQKLFVCKANKISMIHNLIHIV